MNLESVETPGCYVNESSTENLVQCTSLV